MNSFKHRESFQEQPLKTADDYFEMYRNASDKEKAIREIGGMFLRETGSAISKIPTVAPNIPVEQIKTVLERQDAEWRKFAEMVGVVRPDGYEILLEKKHPMFFSILKYGVVNE